MWIISPSMHRLCRFIATLAARSLIAVALFAVASLAQADEEPKITVEMNQDEIFEGQSVTYRLMVENVENPKQPDLGDMSDFEVSSQGQRSLDSQQITIINGVMSQVVHRGREFQFRLTPKKTGQLTIAAPTLNVDGKVIKGAAKQLSVLPPDAQDVVAVELSADRQAVYPTQPFTVTISIFVKQLPPPASDRDPLSVQKPPVALHIPWLTDQDLPPGLSPREDWQAWIKTFIDRQGAGFAINELVRQTAFSFFGEKETITFRPHPTTVERRLGKNDEAKYRRYDFTRTFTAKQVGPVSFAAVSVQGTFVQKIEAARAVGKEIYAASKPLVVTVNDVPTAGRPESYCGAIGTFQLAADLSPHETKVGDPLTLTLTLHGAGSLSAVKPPEIAKNAEIAGRFKVYEATQKSDADTMTFVYSLRPLIEGDQPFPSVPVSYFDVDHGRYETLASDVLPLKVSKSQQLSSDQIVAAPRPEGAAGKELESRREGIYANIDDPSLALDQSVHPIRWLIALGGCMGGYVLIAAITSFVRRRSEDRAGLRRRAAAARARQRLREAAEAWQNHQHRAAADRVQDALAGLVADIADVDEASLTPKEVVERLRRFGLDDVVVANVLRLLDTCDATRYGGAASNDCLIDEARQVLETTIKGLRTAKRT